MKDLVPEPKLSSVSSTQLGLQKLLLGRSDLFCENDTAVLNIMYANELAGLDRLRKVMDIGDPAPLYMYLERKHADLALRLATVLRAMKKEGLLERYRQEVLLELGR